MPTPGEHLDRLIQRRDYLSKRVRIKGELGWENIHDAAERDALTWALEQIARANQDYRTGDKQCEQR